MHPPICVVQISRLVALDLVGVGVRVGEGATASAFELHGGFFFPTQVVRVYRHRSDQMPPMVTCCMCPGQHLRQWYARIQIYICMTCIDMYLPVSFFSGQVG